jgi:hypothetical protein
MKRQPEIDEFAARQLVAMRKRLIATVRGRADQLGKIAVAELLRRRKMTARKAAATRKARTAIKAVRAGDKSQVIPAIEAIRERSILVDSLNRLPIVLDLLAGTPPEVFWPVFLDVWCVCDCTWPWHTFLLDLLRDVHSQLSPRDFMGAENGKFFDALPDLVQVYRGCAAYRTRGISWTADRDVGMKFARGIRFDNEPDRVLVEAIIPKQAIFAVFTDRKESEIVLDP